MTDPRQATAEAIYAAVLEAQRDGGDAVLSAALDLLAKASGENRFRFAASVIRGIKLGRHAIDDREALRRIAAYPPARRRAAASIVARQIAGAEASNTKVNTIANRLRKKLRENKNGGNAYPRRARPVEGEA
jgi:hypothetical protein